MAVRAKTVRELRSMRQFYLLISKKITSKITKFNTLSVFRNLGIFARRAIASKITKFNMLSVFRNLGIFARRAIAEFE